MTRFARFVLLPCAGVVLTLAACSVPPAIDGPPPGASQQFVEQKVHPEPLEPTTAGVWLGILAVAGALCAGALLLVGKRPLD